MAGSICLGIEKEINGDQIMSTREAQDAVQRFEVKATSDSHFSWIRTRLSLERTLMSWVRTAIALIGFGFTIVQFFKRLDTMPGVNPALLPDTPRYFGLALVGAGVLALAISVWQYRWSLSYLWAPPYDRIAGAGNDKMQTPILAICIILLLIGLLTFGAILARVV
jgi:inner membrane protein YidH